MVVNKRKKNLTKSRFSMTLNNRNILMEKGISKLNLCFNYIVVQIRDRYGENKDTKRNKGRQFIDFPDCVLTSEGRSMRTM